VARAAQSHYQRLGVPADADLSTLRQAYRQRAMEFHPDRGSGDADNMAAINAAWAVLSDPNSRAAYDQTLGPLLVRRRTPASPTATAARPQGPQSRKNAWFAGLRVQTRRLGSEAARSAVQALALRHRRPRALYDVFVDEIVESLGTDIDDRVKRARQAGAAPLDLALASALIGVREQARVVARDVSHAGLDDRAVAQAELLDRMWDNLAHGVSREVEQSLGGNPRLLRALTGRRV